MLGFSESASGGGKNGWGSWALRMEGSNQTKRPVVQRAFSHKFVNGKIGHP